MKVWGSKIKLTGTFRNAAGALTDPTVVSLIVRDPDDVERTYTFPTDLTRTSQGVYLLPSLTLDIAGDWLWRWEGTGGMEAVGEGWIPVARSYVLGEV